MAVIGIEPGVKALFVYNRIQTSLMYQYKMTLKPNLCAETAD